MGFDLRWFRISSSICLLILLFMRAFLMVFMLHLINLLTGGMQ